MRWALTKLIQRARRFAGKSFVSLQNLLWAHKTPWNLLWAPQNSQNWVPHSQKSKALHLMPTQSCIFQYWPFHIGLNWTCSCNCNCYCYSARSTKGIGFNLLLHSIFLSNITCSKLDLSEPYWTLSYFIGLFGPGTGNCLDPVRRIGSVADQYFACVGRDLQRSGVKILESVKRGSKLDDSPTETQLMTCVKSQARASMRPFLKFPSITWHSL